MCGNYETIIGAFVEEMHLGRAHDRIKEKLEIILGAEALKPVVECT